MQYSTTEGAQGICPTGWHIPMLAEFKNILSLTISYSANSLKTVGIDATGTNTSGFSALFTGQTFASGYYWTSTLGWGGGARAIELRSNDNSIYYWNQSQNSNFTYVRCIK